MPFALLLDLPPSKRARFAAAARLTEPEAAAMCLSAFAERYPPAAPPPGPGPGKGPGARPWNTRAMRWLCGRVIRWCPECLAGDGTPVQDQLGGAWRGTWRLAAVFGCTCHQRLLAYLCPGCSRPAAAARGPAAAVPDARRSDVHPAHCRLPGPEFPGYHGALVPACDASLTAAPLMQSAALTGPAFALQRRILDLLDPGQPGGAVSVGAPATAAQYFTDLRLVASLIRASWPRVTSLTNVPAMLAELADQDDRRVADGKAPLRRVHDELPPDPAACAALLTTADELLRYSPRDLAQHILHMRAHDSRRAGRVP